ncbi:MAG: STAS domain-containing protein [Alphaproteobacteria bacterium]|nr:STAS domain-containing protein [Alphaproteobacteria bacterium]
MHAATYAAATTDRPQAAILAGAITAATAGTWRSRVERMAEEGRSIELDLSSVYEIDTSGIGAIVFLMKRLRMAGSSLRLSGLAGQPRALLRSLRLDRLLSIAEGRSAPSLGGGRLVLGGAQ